MSFEDYLREQLSGLPAGPVSEAMGYSLMAGGKRVRPRLLFSLLQDYGVPEEAGYPAAAALEMIHTYSLIHDDLPCMDNDDLRRGKPTCHKVYGETMALLAGDGLLTYAFEVLMKTDWPGADLPFMTRVLARCAGPAGMIYGQQLDLQAEKGEALDIEAILEIDAYKTGCLLQAALLLAAGIAAHPADVDWLTSAGRELGLLFQIQDDILDATADEETMGKSLSDAENGKQTAISLLGIDGAGRLASEKAASVRQALGALMTPTPRTEDFLEVIISRSH